MAFMMPVVKNNYEMFPARQRRSNSGGSSRPGSRTVSESEKAANADNLLSPSPPAHIYSSSAPSAGALPAAQAARPQRRSVHFCRSVSTDRAEARRRSNVSRASSSSSGSTASCSDEAASPKFGSLTRFHCKLVDSLKRKLRIKDETDDDAAVIRAST